MAEGSLHEGVGSLRPGRLGSANDQGSEERSRVMGIIGCDFHPRYQQIAALNLDTDELVERRLSHEGKEAAAFYEALPREALHGSAAQCSAQGFESLVAR